VVHSDLPLVGMGQAYLSALVEAGAAPVLIPPGTPASHIDTLVQRLDGLLFSGGVDIDPIRYGQSPHPKLGDTSPRRDELELTLASIAFTHDLPVLGICRGIQLLNVATGGTLTQHLPGEETGQLRHDCFFPKFPRDRLSHTVDLTPSSTAASVMGAAQLQVNTMHHQGIDRLGDGWRAVGLSPDGLIEAIELPGHPFALAVQWHPEQLTAYPEHGLKLFSALVEASRRPQ
jgi:putative glutamine amidotransferase